MKKHDSLDGLIGRLKALQGAKTPPAPSPQWEKKLMHEIRSLQIAKEAAEDFTAAPFFWRLSLAGIILALLVHSSYVFSSIEETIALNSVTQLDALDLPEEIDD